MSEWRRAEEIVHAALERSPDERLAFVRDACSNDDSLRVEVESLLKNVSAADKWALKLDQPGLDLIGQQIGVYRVDALLGVGGMGEVYRARDTRLQRDVAIKALPAVFTGDGDRRARFEREARVLASLNHPHIGAIYGLEESQGASFLVLELVEGITLAERIAKGPLSLSDSLDMARQIADALDAAHEKGIVHRDLKPANIKLTADGKVKVLDFGLAKLSQPSDQINTAATETIATREGAVFGTPGYMSPEQARGRVVDKRTDVWAFGCVLYEMLSGRVAFQGETISDTIAAILEREPSWSALPETTPAGARRLLQRCLDKDPKRRLRDIGDARVEIETTSDLLVSSLSTRAHRRVVLIAAGAATIAVALTAAAVMKLVRTDDHAAHPVTRLTVPLADSDVINTFSPLAAVSRDGKRVVYAANRRLYLRSLEQLEAVPILGTEPPAVLGPGRSLGFAGNPFFSPDGEWVGFRQADELKKVLAMGGVATTVSNLAQAEGGALDTYGPITWSADNTILFASTGREDTRRGGIWRVAAAGGSPELLIPLETGQVATAPQLLPGGSDVLFTVSTGPKWDDADIVVQSLSTGKRHVLARQALGGRYLTSGHLVYGFHGTLYGAKVDLTAHEILGTPVPLVSDVAQIRAMPAGWGAFQYWVSDEGTLVYLTCPRLPKGEGVSSFGSIARVVNSCFLRSRARMNTRVFRPMASVSRWTCAISKPTYGCGSSRGAR